MLRQIAGPLLICLALAAVTNAADGSKRAIVYEGRASDVTTPFVDTQDIWMTLRDLKRVTGFEVKPQGICREELCYPIPKAKKNAFLVRRGSVSWFNLSEFARLVKQPVAYDATHSIWYFGARPDQQNAHVNSLDAPEFTLPDSKGKLRSLSEFRGKKVLLVTWASW